MKNTLTKLTALTGLTRAESVNAGWLVFGTLFRLTFAAAMDIAVARYLEPEGFGELRFAIATMLLFGSLSGFGLGGLTVRELVKTPERRDEILGTVLGLRFLIAVIAAPFAVLTAFALQPGNSDVVIMTAILATMGTLAVMDSVDFLIQAELKSNYTVVARTVSLAVTSAVKIVLIVMDAPLWSLRVCLRRRVLDDGGDVFRGLREDGLLAAEAAVPAIAGEVHAVADLAAVFRGCVQHDQPAGGPGHAGGVQGRGGGGLLRGGLAFHDHLAVCAGRDCAVGVSGPGAGRGTPGTWSTRHDCSCFIPCCAGWAWAWRWRRRCRRGSSSTLLYGPEYSSTRDMLVVQIWASPFIFMGTLFSRWLTIEGRFVLTTFRHALGAFVNVSLNLILIPSYGGMGASVGDRFVRGGVLLRVVLPGVDL